MAFWGLGGDNKLLLPLLGINRCLQAKQAAQIEATNIIWMCRATEGNSAQVFFCFIKIASILRFILALSNQLVERNKIPVPFCAAHILCCKNLNFTLCCCYCYAYRLQWKLIEAKVCTYCLTFIERLDDTTKNLQWEKSNGLYWQLTFSNILNVYTVSNYGPFKTIKIPYFTYLDLDQKLINQKISNLQPLDQTFYPFCYRASWCYKKSFCIQYKKKRKWLVLLSIKLNK